MPSKALCLLAWLLSAGIAAAQGVPHSSHVWIINEENHGSIDIAGNSQMPYYNQLMAQYGTATQFYADQHSSLPALMWYVAGAAVEPNNDTTSCQHSQDNVVRELLSKGYSWRSYQENLPYAGFQGLYSPDNLYYRRHNPLIDFTDVCPGSGQDTNSVPLTQMAGDFASIGTVNFAWITPNVNDDAHNGPIEAADQWLQANVPSILARPEFQPGGDGMLFIVWDESDLNYDNSCSATVSQGCGGHVETLVIGPQVIRGYQSTVTYRSENVLATVCAALGLATCPGAAQNTVPMSEFFYPSVAAAAVPTDSIRIAMPTSGATVVGPVNFIASASESLAVGQSQVWDNGIKLGWYPGSQINATYNLAPGSHTTTVLDLDANNNIIRESSITYNVQAPVSGVQILSPAANQNVTASLVHIAAQANEPQPVGQTQIWDNGTKLGYFASANIDQYYTLAPGSHTVTIFDQDVNGNNLNQSSISYAVAASAPGVQILSPTLGASLNTPTIRVVAGSTEPVPVNQVQVWDNGTKLGWMPGSQIDQVFALAPGAHTLTVLDQDNNFNVLHQASVSYNVSGPTYGVQIVTPTSSGSVTSSTVQIVAQAKESVTVNQMQLWDNGTKLGWYPGSSVNQSFTLAPGKHTLTVLDQDNNFNVLHTANVTYTVE